MRGFPPRTTPSGGTARTHTPGKGKTMKRKTFPNLGVQVYGSEVRTFSLRRGKLLGQLPGAQAEVSEAGTIHAGRAIAHALVPGTAWPG